MISAGNLQSLGAPYGPGKSKNFFLYFYVSAIAKFVVEIKDISVQY